MRARLVGTRPLVGDRLARGAHALFFEVRAPALMLQTYTFTRGIHLSKAAIIEATESREQCKALLEHLSSISRPNDGAPLILLLFARLATLACDWLDGDLRVELEMVSGIRGGSEKGEPARARNATLVTVMVEMGGGFRERVFSGIEMRVPLDEFTGAIERVPQMVQPLLAKRTPNGLVLTATEEVRTSTLAPAILIDEAFLIIPPPPVIPKLASSPRGGAGLSSEPEAHESDDIDDDWDI